MKVNYHTRNGRLSVELSGDDQKGIFAEIAKFQEVFEESVCGKCGSDRGDSGRGGSSRVQFSLSSYYKFP